MSNIVRLVSASDVTTRKKQQGTTNRYNAMQQQDILPIGGIPFADLYDIAHTSALYTDQTTACIPCEGDVNFVLRQYKPLPSCTFQFTQRSVPVPPSTRAWTGVASSGTGQYLAAICTNGFGSHGFVSSDYGVTWINPLNNPINSWNSITMDSTGQYMATCTYNDEIWISINWGVDWVPSGGYPFPPTLSAWVSVSYSSDGSNAAAGGNNEIWISNGNHGQYFVPLSSLFGFPITWRNWSGVACGALGGSPRGIGIEGTNIWTFDAYALVEYPGSVTWRAVACNNDCSVIFVVSSANQIIKRSTNSGLTWTTVTPAPSLNWSGISVSPDGTKIFACAEGGQLYKSTDTGATWEALTVNPPPQNQKWTGVASSSDGEKLAAVDGTDPDAGYIYTFACT